LPDRMIGLEKEEEAAANKNSKSRGREGWCARKRIGLTRVAVEHAVAGMSRLALDGSPVGAAPERFGDMARPQAMRAVFAFQAYDAAGPLDDAIVPVLKTWR
jgi:hypothetical protein